MNSEYRMIVAGGGTGGHFFPAQTISKSLRENGVIVKYMGSIYGIEASFFDEKDKFHIRKMICPTAFAFDSSHFFLNCNRQSPH